MAAYRTQITLKTGDSNPANYATNTWYCAAVSDAAAGDFTTEVIAAYQDVRAHISPDVVQNGHFYKIYAMDDPEPRAPIEEGTWNFTSGLSGTALPAEVAICLSFQGDKISGVPQSRRRGRIYFGPLNTGAVSSGRPSSSLITAVVLAGQGLLDAGQASLGDWNWAVYSGVNGGTADVTNGWCDNEFDTQRRRGRAWTSRTTFS